MAINPGLNERLIGATYNEPPRENYYQQEVRVLSSENNDPSYNSSYYIDTLHKIGSFIFKVLAIVYSQLERSAGYEPPIITEITDLCIKRDGATGQNKQAYQDQIEVKINEALFLTLEQYDRDIQRGLANLLSMDVNKLQERIDKAIKADREQLRGRLL